MKNVYLGLSQKNINDLEQDIILEPPSQAQHGLPPACDRGLWLFVSAQLF